MQRSFRLTMLSALVLVSMLALSFVFAGLAQPPVVQADTDDRINCHNASPIVIYCSDVGVTVYSTAGEKILFVSSDALDAVGTPDENTMVGESASIAMYVLDTGEYQINYYGAEELYVAIWTGCHIGAADINVYDAQTGAFISGDEGCEVEEVATCVAVDSEDSGFDAYVECVCGSQPESGDLRGDWWECACGIDGFRCPL